MKKDRLSIRRLLIISRPFWWVNTSVPFLVGALLASESLHTAVIVGFLYFLIPYNIMMYGVNDIFDYESDIENPRKNGGINGSVLPLTLHKKLWFFIAASNLPFLVYFVAIGSIFSTVFLAAMIGLVFAYSVKGFRYKEIPVLDSLTSAFHYSSPFVFAVVLFSGFQDWLGIFVAFFLWVAANHAFGAIQDIAPDRKANISSIATKFGSAKTLYFSIFLYLIASIVPIIEYGTAGLFGTAAIMPYLIIVLRCLPHKRSSESPRFSKAWKSFLYCNYIVGAIGSVILLYLYNR